MVFVRSIMNRSIMNRSNALGPAEIARVA